MLRGTLKWVLLLHWGGGCVLGVCCGAEAACTNTQGARRQTVDNWQQWAAGSPAAWHPSPRRWSRCNATHTHTLHLCTAKVYITTQHCAASNSHLQRVDTLFYFYFVCFLLCFGTLSFRVSLSPSFNLSICASVSPAVFVCVCVCGCVCGCVCVSLSLSLWLWLWL